MFDKKYLIIIVLLLLVGNSSIAKRMTLSETENGLSYDTNGYYGKYKKEIIPVFANPRIFNTPAKRGDFIQGLGDLNDKLKIEFKFRGFKRPRAKKYIYVTGRGRYRGVGALGFAEYKTYRFNGSFYQIRKCNARIVFGGENLTALSLHEILHCAGVAHHDRPGFLMSPVIGSLRLSNETISTVETLY